MNTQCSGFWIMHISHTKVLWHMQFCFRASPAQLGLNHAEEFSACLPSHLFNDPPTLPWALLQALEILIQFLPPSKKTWIYSRSWLGWSHCPFGTQKKSGISLFSCTAVVKAWITFGPSKICCRTHKQDKDLGNPPQQESSLVNASKA